MEIQAFVTLALPFIIVIYLGVLLFVHPTKPILLASLLGGLILGAINILFDLLAYYAHWWHYTIQNGLILHLPLPFYVSPILVYGSIAYILIWRFWQGRFHWFSLLLLIAVPLFRATTDIVGAITQGSNTQYDSPIAGLMNVIMWLIMFYAGFFVFTRFVHLNVTLREQE